MKINKKLILTILAAIIVIGAGTWFYFYTEGQKYYSTDNAKVMAELKNVVSTAGGELIKWDAEPNLLVKENQVIGRTSTGVDIKSPITGIVAKSNVVLNQTISPSATLAIVADVNDIYVQANIEETAVAKLAIGQEVQMKLDAFPGKKFIGHVREIDTVTVAALSGGATSFNTSGTYTKVTQLIPVKISLDDEVALDKLIGTNAFVKINLEKVNAEAAKAEQAANDESGKNMEITGKVKAKTVRDIALDFSASVASVPVIDGQKLKAGETIVELDLHEIQKLIADQEKNLKIENLQLKRLLSGASNTSQSEGNVVKTAEDNYAKAKEDLAKQEQLLQVGAATTEAVNDAKRKVATTERALSDAKLSKGTDNQLNIEIEKQKIALMNDQLKQLKDKLNKPYIKGNAIVSEFENGLVQGITLVPGNILSPSMKLFSVVDLNSLVVEADIPENQVKYAKVGSAVTIVPVADTSKSYTGKITAISASGTVKNGETVVTAEIAIDKPDESIKPNFNVDVNIKN